MPGGKTGTPAVKTNFREELAKAVIKVTKVTVPWVCTDNSPGDLMTNPE